MRAHKEASEGDGRTKGDIANELAILEKEVAKLRAEAADLENDQEAYVLEERKKQFKEFDTDGSGAIDLDELKAGVKRLKNGMELDDAAVTKLLSMLDTNQDGVLQIEEFDVNKLMASIEQLTQEKREQENARYREERLRLQAERELKEYEDSLPAGNEAKGFPARLGSALAYLLPLLDGLQFGLPLAAQLPGYLPALIGVLVPAEIALNSVPTLQFIIFIGMQLLADNTDLPRLLRFNLRQAIVLDVSLFFPRIGFLLGDFALQGRLTEMMRNPAVLDTPYTQMSGLVFLVLFACILYSAIASFLGTFPDQIPVISSYAKSTMRKTRLAEDADGEGRRDQKPAASGEGQNRERNS